MGVTRGKPLKCIVQQRAQFGHVFNRVVGHCRSEYIRRAAVQNADGGESSGQPGAYVHPVIADHQRGRWATQQSERFSYVFGMRFGAARRILARHQRVVFQTGLFEQILGDPAAVSRDNPHGDSNTPELGEKGSGIWHQLGRGAHLKFQALEFAPAGLAQGRSPGSTQVAGGLLQKCEDIEVSNTVRRHSGIRDEREHAPLHQAEVYVRNHEGAIKIEEHRSRLAKAGRFRGHILPSWRHRTCTCDAMQHCVSWPLPAWRSHVSSCGPFCSSDYSLRRVSDSAAARRAGCTYLTQYRILLCTHRTFSTRLAKPRGTSMRSDLRRLFAFSVVSIAAVCGCSKPPAPKPVAAKPEPPPRVSEIDLKSYKPNEAGAIMIVMYHRVSGSEASKDLNRPPEEFRKDLETLYEKGYRPVNVADIVSGKLDVPAGKTPIAITFDDALPTQFKLVPGSDGQPRIDPDCAVGIMETFSKSKKDWPMKATFFVLPKSPFGALSESELKLDYLRSKGYEIASHTYNHRTMRGMSSAAVQKELALALRELKRLAPQAEITSLALPYGVQPREETARQSLLSGQDAGTAYKHSAVLLASWRPVLSPYTKHDKKASNGGSLALYNPAALERIVPDKRKPRTPGTLEYYLDFFDKNPGLRYVSDGNPRVVAVPKMHAEAVDEEKVKAAGKTLQLYSLGDTPGASGTGAGGLSVEDRVR